MDLASTLKGMPSETCTGSLEPQGDVTATVLLAIIYVPKVMFTTDVCLAIHTYMSPLYYTTTSITTTTIQLYNTTTLVQQPNECVF